MNFEQWHQSMEIFRNKERFESEQVIWDAATSQAISNMTIEHLESALMAKHKQLARCTAQGHKDAQSSIRGPDNAGSIRHISNEDREREERIAECQKLVDEL